MARRRSPTSGAMRMSRPASPPRLKSHIMKISPKCVHNMFMGRAVFGDSLNPARVRRFDGRFGWYLMCGTRPLLKPSARGHGNDPARGHGNDHPHQNTTSL